MVDLIHITPAQMRMFEAGAEEAFQRRVVQQVRDYAPPSLAGLDDAGLARVVRAGVTRARGYGMTWQSTLAGFVNVMTDVSPNWDGQPDIHASLLRRRDVADAQFERLFDDVTEQAWKDAIAMRSGVGWFLPLPLSWSQLRERVAAALPPALEAARPVDPGTALALADAGQSLALSAGLDSEDAVFLSAVGLVTVGEARIRKALQEEGHGVLNSRPGHVGVAVRIAGVRAWVRRNTGLWV